MLHVLHAGAIATDAHTPCVLLPLAVRVPVLPDDERASSASITLRIVLYGCCIRSVMPTGGSRFASVLYDQRHSRMLVLAAGETLGATRVFVLFVVACTSIGLTADYTRPGDAPRLSDRADSGVSA